MWRKSHGRSQTDIRGARGVIKEATSVGGLFHLSLPRATREFGWPLFPLDISLRPFQERSRIVCWHRLDKPPRAELQCEGVGDVGIVEAPAHMIAAFGVAPAAPVTRLNAALGMEGVHVIKPLAEAAGRDRNLDHVREVPLDGFGSRSAFVSRHGGGPSWSNHMRFRALAIFHAFQTKMNLAGRGRGAAIFRGPG